MRKYGKNHKKGKSQASGLGDSQEARWAAVPGGAKSRTRLSDSTKLNANLFPAEILGTR